MPGLVTKLFALPKMRKYVHTVLLIQDEQQGLKFPSKEKTNPAKSPKPNQNNASGSSASRNAFNTAILHFNDYICKVSDFRIMGSHNKCGSLARELFKKLINSQCILRI